MLYRLLTLNSKPLTIVRFYYLCAFAAFW